ncbi:hypothetical protein RCIP0075_00031 [Klebsiella phage RCIP0075]
MADKYSCGNKVQTGDIIERVQHHICTDLRLAGHVVGAIGVAESAVQVRLKYGPAAATYLNPDKWKLVRRASALSDHEERTLELVKRIQQAEADKLKAQVQYNEADAALESAKALLIQHASRIA